MKTADFDSDSSELSKQIKFVVTKNKPVKKSDYLSIVKGKTQTEMGISIKSDSIFCPGDDPKKCQPQLGFRCVLHFFCFDQADDNFWLKI